MPCSGRATVVMSIITAGAGQHGKRALCSEHALRYAQLMAPQLDAGLALLQYDFNHREAS